MNRVRIIVLLGSLPLAALVWWVAQNTYWDDVTVPLPLRGEARTNPFYAAQRFAGALGARTAWNRIGLVLPPPDGVLVLSAWNWNLSANRRQAVERWVESGGRLVVDSLMIGGREEFEAWSGIVEEFDEDAIEERDDAEPVTEPGTLETEETEQSCRELEELQADAGPARYNVCDIQPWTFLEVRETAATWALGDESGLHVIRAAVGRGSVTVVNGAPFRFRALLDGDHGRLLVAAAGLRRGDVIHFQSEDEHASLPALIWHYGAPVVVLLLALTLVMLWRGAVRFGPLEAPPDPARRSIAEQIRGTAQFALRHGGGDALHAAAVRALHEAGQRRIARYRQMPLKHRAAALHRLTRFDAGALAAAISHTTNRSQEFYNRIALVESARRKLVVEPPHRTPHDAK